MNWNAFSIFSTTPKKTVTACLKQRKFGEFFESKWIGHSYKVAKKHYLKIRDIDYGRAVDLEENKPEEANSSKNDEKKGVK